MAAVYYERIDVEGHHYGPWSEQRKSALKELDKAMSNMITQIKVSGVGKPSSGCILLFFVLWSLVAAP